MDEMLPWVLANNENGERREQNRGWEVFTSQCVLGCQISQGARVSGIKDMRRKKKREKDKNIYSVGSVDDFSWVCVAVTQGQN